MEVNGSYVYPGERSYFNEILSHSLTYAVNSQQSAMKKGRLFKDESVERGEKHYLHILVQFLHSTSREG